MTESRLFDRTRDYNDIVFRNIVSLRTSINLFDDILDEEDEDALMIVAQAEAHAKRNIPPGILDRGFHYSTAIGYPFETQPFMSSRYGDGTYPVWYGSIEQDTTIFETAYHMFRAETAVEGVKEKVQRERAVYQVSCRAILIDLCGKEKEFPDLTGNDYNFTQSIGKRLAFEGHPGMITPSARCPGANAVIMKQSVLSKPKLIYYLTYVFDPTKNTITVERDPHKPYLKIPC